MELREVVYRDQAITITFQQTATVMINTAEMDLINDIKILVMINTSAMNLQGQAVAYQWFQNCTVERGARFY